MIKQRWTKSFLSAAIAGLVMIAGTAALAEDLDYHALFEGRCTACHGHAGAFAREHLQVQDGVVLGSAGQNLEPFLSVHKGGLPAEQIRGLLDMFLSQLEAGSFFNDTCKICHGRAHDFAKLFLIERDGVLWGRYSARPVAEFLPGHARMTADQALRMTAALSAILAGGR